MDKMKHYSIVIIPVFVLVVLVTMMYNPNEQSLGDGYWYDMEGKRVFGPDIDIPPTAKIIKCKRDYVIVEQYPPKYDDAIYEYEYNYPYGRDTTYYWIIYKKEHLFVGPFLRSELDSILLERNIQL